MKEKEVTNYLDKAVIKIFVYGTLRRGQRLGFYMEGAKYLGRYYTNGQLMKSENDNVYIDFDYQQAITIGEVYLVNFYCLQRINHLEVLSGTFPKGYDLNILPVWKIDDKTKEYTLDNNTREIAFYYKWKNCPVKILTGDFTDDFVAIDELEKILVEHRGQVTSDEILDLMKQKLSIFESFNF